MEETGRRSKDRLPVKKTLKFIEPSEITGQLINFSSDGVGIEVSEPISLQTAVTIEMFGGDLTASGHIVWINNEAETVQVGVVFREEDQILIDHYLELRGHN